MSYLYFSILVFSISVCSIKIGLSGNTVWPQTSDFQNSSIWQFYGIFKELLSTQNVNVTCNVEWDFLDKILTFGTVCWGLLSNYFRNSNSCTIKHMVYYKTVNRIDDVQTTLSYLLRLFWKVLSGAKRDRISQYALLCSIAWILYSKCERCV